MVIFGASGDLTAHKLIPSLFRLHQRELLPRNFFILGFARTPMSVAGFQQKVRNILVAAGEQMPDEADKFSRLCLYQPGDYHDPALYHELKKHLDRLDRQFDCQGNIAFYLSTPPKLYADIATRLADAGLLQKSADADAGSRNWRRLIVEKPFGHDLESALALEKQLHQVLDEDQIYRIDHYLGKETVQNILMLRFANLIFEPLWNRQYIDSVQITAAEDIGIGNRAGYYEQTGILRDMFQNHMLQLLCLAAMEPPASFAAHDLHDEKLKLLRSLRPFTTEESVNQRVLRGQYVAGQVHARKVAAYRDEDKVAPQSRTETFVAAQLFIDNWRWRGVPFYLRTGKRMPRKSTRIVVQFKPVPHSIFDPLLPEHLVPNQLVLNVQPQEGAALTIQAKKPGPKFCMAGLTMAFNYREVFNSQPPEAYERLLLDIMLGDQTLFVRNDVIEMEWRLIMPVLKAWSKPTSQPPRPYKAGTWGPAEASQLLQQDHRKWYDD